MTKIFFDLETIPTQDIDLQDYISESVKAPGNYKDPDKIAAYLTEARTEAVEKSSFDGALNHIICIGYAFDDQPAQTLHIEDAANEAKIIKEFYDILLANCRGFLPGNTFIGHNIIGFDLRVLKHRSIILGVKPPMNFPFDAKPWDKSPYDTMMQWDGKNSAKLEKIARALKIPGKTADGSQVYQMWRDKDFARLCEYCRDDVELTRKVYKRMEFITDDISVFSMEFGA